MKTRSIETRFLSIVLSLLMVLTMLPAASFKAYADTGSNTPLTFTAQEDNSSVTIKLREGVALQYSTDGEQWDDYTPGTTIQLSNSGDTVYFRGTNKNKQLFDDSHKVSITGKVACSGNIMTLVDWEDPDNAAMGSNCFNYMFEDCTGLTTAPELPATTLADSCYDFMFYGCTSLTTAPELPATTLADSCYDYMFSGCTSLTTAPELPATTLANFCYICMFANCTGLTTAPELPATTLADYCYYAMFYNCTGLTTAPELPATTLADYCYYGMFYGCTSLITAPELPATTLSNYCYNSMFMTCTGLTTAPELPATTLAKYCYSGMFYGCTGLTTAPELPATTLADYCYYYMFYGCTGIMLSTTQTEECNTEYRIPSSGEGTTASDALTDMFGNTGGTFTGTPDINTIYYIKRAITHTHNFTYTASGAIITATCDAGNCDLTENKVTLTITAPTLTTYDGTSSASATLTGLTDFNDVTGKTVAESDIKYVGRDNTVYEESTNAPRDAGNYTASITVEEKTAAVNFTIAKADMTPDEVTARSATYGQTLANVTLPTADDGTWAWEDPATTYVGNAGTHTFTAVFTPTNTNYNTVEQIVTVNVAKAAPTPDEVTDLTAAYGKTLEDVVLPNGWTWDAPETSVGNVGDNAFAATYTPDDTANYNTLNQDLTVTVVPVNKTALNDALTNANNYLDTIKNDADYAAPSSDLSTAISTVNAVLTNDNVTEAQVAQAITDVNNAVITAKSDVKDIDDTKAAQAVTNKINALTAAENVSTADKTDIEAARAAYDALTQEQKEKVSSTTYVKLLDAEKALAAAEKEAADTEAANTVISQINALPASTAVTLSHKNSIEAARTAYDALTADQQAKVPTNTYNKLTADEAAIATLEKNAADTTAANAVRNLINALPASTAVTLTDKADIEEARAAYDALTEDQKSKIATNTLNRLTNAESALADAEQKEATDTAAAKSVTDAINALPASTAVTVNNKNSIEAARSAYNALTADQKAKISSGTYNKLIEAETALAAAEKEAADTSAANAVITQINALPASTDVTLSNKDIIEAARTAYDALTADQQTKVPTNTYNKLTADEAALASAEKNAADTAAANTVTTQINALPASTAVTVDDNKNIKSARAAYDALTADQKAKVSNTTYKKLTDAEAALEIENVNTASAKAVSDQINALPESTAVTLANKTSIEAARKAYDELSADQKVKVSSDTYDKLISVETALAAAEKEAADTAAANTVSNVINALPASADVTVDDKENIEAARTAYDALTADQKAKVPGNTYNKLTADETALAAVEKEIADTAAAKAVTDMIGDLPANADITVDDKEDIEAARTAYDALTPDQKAKVSDYTYTRLINAESALEKEETDTAAAKAATDLISALPASADVTVDDKENIEAARTAYDALTADQKAKVSDDTYKKLTEAEATLKKEEDDTAAANTVADMIDALPADTDVTIDDKTAVEAARAEYDELTPDQQAKVSRDAYNKLTNAETAISEAEKNAALTAQSEAEQAKKDADVRLASVVSDILNALPTTEDITKENASAVSNARLIFDMLTDDQKAMVSEDAIKKLTDDEAAVAALEEEAKIVKGDVNFDGKINITDLIKVAAHVKGKKLLDENAAKAADVNNDGKINITDIIKIAAHIKGKKLLK